MNQAAIRLSRKLTVIRKLGHREKSLLITLRVGKLLFPDQKSITYGDPIVLCR
jgi:hypothetical protein